MTIKTLLAKFFKGADTINQEFTPFNIIVGDNAEGKTRLLQAIRVGLTGYEPALGKQKTGKLASGPTMETTLVCDNQTINRTWKRTATGGISEKEVPESVPEIPSIMLDFRNFLKMTGPEQVAYVIGQSDLEKLGFTKDALTADIKAIIPASPTEETEAAMRLILADIAETDKTTAKENLNLNAWLGLLLEKLKERLKLANAEIKRFTGAIQTAVQNTVEQTIRTKPEIDGDLEIARAYKSECESQLSVIQSQLQQWQQSEARRETLNRIIAGPSKATEIQTLRERIQKGEEMTAGKEPRARNFVNTLGDARAQYALAQNATKQAMQEVEDVTVEIEKHVADVKPCPCCRQTGDQCEGWQRRKNEIADLLLRKRLKFSECEELEATAKLHFDNSKVIYDDELDKDNKLGAAQNLLRQLNSQLASLLESEKAIDNARAELAGLASAPEPDQSAATVLRNAIKETIAKITTLEYEQTLASAEAGKELEREKTRLRQLTKQAEIDVTKLAINVVTAKQTELVNSSMEFILCRARKFTDGIIKGSLAWDGEIGIWRGKQWVSHEVFSGTEQAIAYVGLSAALTENSPFKLVIMDELGVVSDKNLKLLLDKVWQLIQDGTISQFIACDVRNRYGNNMADGANIITV